MEGNRGRGLRTKYLISESPDTNLNLRETMVQKYLGPNMKSFAA